METNNEASDFQISDLSKDMLHYTETVRTILVSAYLGKIDKDEYALAYRELDDYYKKYKDYKDILKNM